MSDTTVEIYYKKLVEWGKKWILIYCEKVVMLNEEGDMIGIRGQFKYGFELKYLCNPLFTDEEKEEYQNLTEVLLLELVELRKQQTKQLKYLIDQLKLSEFEWFLLILSWITRLDKALMNVFDILQNNMGEKIPSIDLCIRMYTLYDEEQYRLQCKIIKRWDILGQLFDGISDDRLCDMDIESNFMMPLKLNERIFMFLMDGNSKDPVLKHIVTYYYPEDILSPMWFREEELTYLNNRYEAFLNHMIYIYGNIGSGRRFLVQHFCKQIGKILIIVDIHHISFEEYLPIEILKHIKQEAFLCKDAVVCFHDIDLDILKHKQLADLAYYIFGEKQTALLFTSNKKRNPYNGVRVKNFTEIKIPKLTREEIIILWKKISCLYEIETGIAIENFLAWISLTPEDIKAILLEYKKREAHDKEIPQIEAILKHVMEHKSKWSYDAYKLMEILNELDE